MHGTSAVPTPSTAGASVMNGENCHRGDDATQVLSMSTLGGNRRDAAEVVRGGIEPPTHGFSVRCSTN